MQRRRQLGLYRATFLRVLMAMIRVNGGLGTMARARVKVKPFLRTVMPRVKVEFEVQGRQPRIRSELRLRPEKRIYGRVLRIW